MVDELFQELFLGNFGSYPVWLFIRGLVDKMNYDTVVDVAKRLFLANFFKKFISIEKTYSLIVLKIPWSSFLTPFSHARLGATCISEFEC